MRKPSAALVVASAALVMSTIGTSIAATHYVITSSAQIKPGAISLAALSKDARKALRGQRGPKGDTGAAGPAGVTGAAGAPATKLWAQVWADGTLNASSPGVTSRLGVTPGTYAVNFGQDITHCAAMATQGSIPAFSKPGSGSGGVTGAPQVLVYSAGSNLAPGYPSASTAIVATSNGTAAGASTAAPFFIAVLC
jgi:hypothetical protein